MALFEATSSLFGSRLVVGKPEELLLPPPSQGSHLTSLFIWSQQDGGWGRGGDVSKENRSYNNIVLSPRLHLLFQDRFSFWPGGFSPRVGSQARGKFLFDWLFPDVIVCACVCVLHLKWPLNRCGKNCCALLSLEWTTSHPRREGRFHANTVSEEGFGLLCYCEVVWGKGDFSISLLWNFDSTLLTKP